MDEAGDHQQGDEEDFKRNDVVHRTHISRLLERCCRRTGAGRRVTPARRTGRP